MSKMLALLNKLKTQAVPDWLTDSQQAAFDAVRDALRFPETVNLHRPAASRAILTPIGSVSDSLAPWRRIGKEKPPVLTAQVAFCVVAK